MADELPDELKRVARELGLGATGRYPHGRLDDTDQGELRAALAVEAGKIVLNFGKPVGWVAMTPGQARGLAAALVAKADAAEGRPG